MCVVTEVKVYNLSPPSVSLQFNQGDVPQVSYLQPTELLLPLPKTLGLEDETYIVRTF